MKRAALSDAAPARSSFLKTLGNDFTAETRLLGHGPNLNAMYKARSAALAAVCEF
jgi:hypothetical protein